MLTNTIFLSFPEWFQLYSSGFVIFGIAEAASSQFIRLVLCVCAVLVLNAIIIVFFSKIFTNMTGLCVAA